MTPSLGAAGSRAAGAAMAVYLTEKQLDDAAMRTADDYARADDGEVAIRAGAGCLPIPRADMAPEVARALGVDPSKPLALDAFTNLLTGLRADGAALEGHGRGVGAYEAREGSDAVTRHEVAYVDMTYSAPKSLSVAWALAKTEAERASLLRSHQTAVAETMGYVERQIGWARTGAGGKGPRERARFGWVTCQHYTARPTLDRVCTDQATGERYTETRSLTITGDPQLHSHVLIPNLMVTESGRVVALNTVFHGRSKEFGTVYQAVLARELQAMGVHVVLDEHTKLARLPAVPERVCEAFSKRNRDAEDAARERAVSQGRDYDALGPEEKSALLAYGAASSRLDKESNRPNFEAWANQAAEMGYEHAGVVAHGPPAPARTEAERLAAADEAGLTHLADMLSKDAVIGQGDARVAAARGFIAEGIGPDVSRDMDGMIRAWADGGVVQDGEWTKLVWRTGERGQVRLTTELHRDQEDELIRLARSAAEDRTHALSPEEVAAAVSRSGIGYGPSKLDPTGEHGARQRAAIETLGTDASLSVLVGVGGSGKTKGVLPPLVDAWRARGFDVWGTGQRWGTATDLKGGGIDGFRVRALSVLLDGLDRGQTKLTRNSVVVLDELGQVGTRELLRLLRHRERIGFAVKLAGDDEQCQSVEAGPVVDLLRRALGEGRIPEILTTIRQATQEERRVSLLWREGRAGEALAAKREAGTAEMVPGGYHDAVRRVAELYAERRRATHNQPGYRITISAPTNADAREIGRAVRELRRGMGEITGRDHRVSATDGRGDAYVLDLAAGDRVRLYARTRGLAVCKDGRRRGVSVGDNGSVLDVLAVLPDEGLKVRTANGTEAFVPWTALRDREGTGRVLLAHGDCLTIDSSQGLTSDEHINALVAGSRGATGFKAYVAESRHRVRSWMVLSEGAELREAAARRAAGPSSMSREGAREAAWANAAHNLGRKRAKESALAFLEGAAAGRREAVKLYQGVRRRQEARAAAGRPRETLRAKARERAVQAALPAVGEAVSEAAKQRAAAAASLRALWKYCENKLDRRIEAAARMMVRGEMDPGEAVARVLLLEAADQRRGHPVNPLHGLPIRPLAMLESMEDGHVLEDRVWRKLDAAVDRLSPTPAERSPAARQSSAATA